MTYDLSDQTKPVDASKQCQITQSLFINPPYLSKYYLTCRLCEFSESCRFLEKDRMHSAITDCIKTPTQGIYFQSNSNDILQGLPRWSS